MEFLFRDGLVIDLATGEDVTHKYSERGVFVRTPYNYDVDAASDAAGTVNDKPTMTQQQFKEEVDINTIVERFGLTGQLPENVRVPEYGDYTDAVTDYHTALNMLNEADAAFMQLPAKVREEFGNNPQRLLEFVADEKNAARAAELGITNPRVVKAAEAVKADVVAPPVPEKTS